MYNHAYVTFLIRNDSYLPGALVLAHVLRECRTPADLVCLVTEEISGAARRRLSALYDAVIPVPDISLASCADQHRQYLGQVLTRVNALRLGSDGDLGCGYEKVVLLDADIMPLRCYDHLFLLPSPAGILNERREHLKAVTDSGVYAWDDHDLKHGRWRWHDVYRSIPHGALIPASVTDRVRANARNYGVNTAVMVLKPDMGEYNRIVRELSGGTGDAALLPRFRWPDMQYLTLRWSGRWHNIDACFAGICGYPKLSVLFGTHFAGPKPWQLRNKSVTKCFSRYPDYRRWYAEFVDLMDAHSDLREAPRLARIMAFAAGHADAAPHARAM